MIEEAEGGWGAGNALLLPYPCGDHIIVLALIIQQAVHL